LKERHQYVYGTHYAPHDIEVRELGTGKTRKETAYELGLDFRTVKRMSQKVEGIEAARNLINSCWFDEENCRYGIDALASYTKEYDESNRVFKTRPVHNWASHAADAFQTLAMGHTFYRIDQATLDKIRYKKRGKSWMAA
jgi:phage terminase large subunit